MVDTQFRVPPTLCKTLTLLFKLFAENILYQRAFWDFYSSVAKVKYDKWPNPAAWQETPQWLSSYAPWFLPSFTGLWLQMQNPVLRKGEKFCNRDFDLLRRTCDRISPISSVVSVVPVCAVSQQPHAHVKEEGEGGRINSQKPDVFEYEPKLGKKKVHCCFCDCYSSAAQSWTLTFFFFVLLAQKWSETWYQCINHWAGILGAATRNSGTK